MKLQINLIVILLIVSTWVDAQPRVRPDNWAQPVINAELENFYRVSDKLYRSEQPDKKAFKELQSMGIMQVLNLRKHHTDRDEGRNTAIKLYHLRMSARKLTESQVFDALKVIKESQDPILIHCWHGSDRTGVVAAAYRMVFQNWTAAQAIDEFKNGGFGYHEWAFPNLEELLNQLDIKKLRMALGLNLKNTQK